MQENWKTSDKMAALSPHISITTLNEMDRILQSRRRVTGWIKNQDPIICCLQETHLGSKDKQAQSEGMEYDSPSQWQTKESRCGHTYIRQSRLQDKKAMGHKKGLYITIKGTFHQRTEHL